MFGLIKNSIKTKIGIVFPASYPASRVSLTGGGNVDDRFTTVYDCTSADLRDLLPQGVSAVYIASGTVITDRLTGTSVTIPNNMRGFVTRHNMNVVGWVSDYSLANRFYVAAELNVDSTWDHIRTS